MAEKTYIVTPLDGEPVEVKADRGEQDSNSTRVTFYKGDETVASFINIRSWHEKASK